MAIQMHCNSNIDFFLQMRTIVDIEVACSDDVMVNRILAGNKAAVNMESPTYNYSTST